MFEPFWPRVGVGVGVIPLPACVIVHLKPCSADWYRLVCRGAEDFVTLRDAPGQRVSVAGVLLLA